MSRSTIRKKIIVRRNKEGHLCSQSEARSIVHTMAKGRKTLAQQIAELEDPTPKGA
jgi:hypothetical protein